MNTQKQISSHAAAAKAIRTELKQLFPQIKFRVASKSYAGGNSVDVYYTDGPISDVINEVVKKYQYGSFDGMTDSYNMTNVNRNIPQVQYTFANRSIDEKHYETAFEYVKKHFSGCENLADLTTCDVELNKKWSAWTARDLISRLIRKLDLTNGLDVTKLVGV